MGVKMIKEIRRKKEQLRDGIAMLVKDFENDTGVQILHIGYVRKKNKQVKSTDIALLLENIFIVKGMRFIYIRF